MTVVQEGKGRMEVHCTGCDYSTAIDGTLLPQGGMEGLCPRCRASIPLGGWMAPAPAPEAAAPEIPPSAPTAAEMEDLPEEGQVSLINIIALITLVDSTLSLIGRVPGLGAALGDGTGLTFHQQAKYLYDTLMATGFFVSVFGLMARKNWARKLIVCLFGLGFAEGVYFLLYQQAAIAELERNMHESFGELRRQQYAKLVGCALYAFFIVKLESRTTKARFR